MTLEESWRQKSDEELIAAVTQLKDYAEDAQAVIQEEISRRGISPDSQRPMGNEPGRKHRPRFFLGPINSIEHANYVIRVASKNFYWLAAIQMIVGVVYLGVVVGRIQSFWGIIDVAVFSLGGFFLSKTKKPNVAKFLISWTVLIGIVSFLDRIIDGIGGSVVLAAVALWCALRGYKATVYLRSLEQTTSTEQEEESSDLH